jgi:hypothetical protein
MFIQKCRAEKCPKFRTVLEKRLANLWSRKKIMKKAHAGRGQEPKWEIPVDMNSKAIIFLAAIMPMALHANPPLVAAVPERGFISARPAQTWENALISGNGKLGALVYGRPLDETIVLNHARLFMPLNEPLPPVDTASHLKEIRQMLTAGQPQRAADFVVELSHQQGYGAKRWTDPFIPAFDLRIEMASNGPMQNYRRSVDFATGVTAVEWSDAGGEFQRQLFVSRPDDMVVLSIRASKRGAVDCELRVATHPASGQGGWSEEQGFRNGIAQTAPAAEAGWLTYRSQFKRSWPGSLQGCEGVARVLNKGGKVAVLGDGIVVRGADEVLVLARFEPVYDYSRSQIPSQKKDLARVSPDFNSLLRRHAKIHGEIFNRMHLDLGGGPDRALTSEELIARAQTGRPSAALLEKEFDAGRYAVISSSGEMFPNLQGLWGGSYGPPWSGDFTLNGNVPCAIAADLPANMAGCLLPFFDFLESHVPDFRTNAARLYGCGGILVPSRASSHGLNNHFDATWPMTFWTAGAGWAAQFYFDYYLYTGDKKFLRERALPFMRQAALFYEDFLVEGPDGKWLFSPSYSPENNPANSPSQACINATMDIAIASELLRNCIAACQELQTDADAVNRWRAMLAKMPDYQINADGAVKEWTTPLLQDHDAHRHCSHLYALYDGLPEEIAANAPLRRAFAVALEKRLDVRRAEFSSKSGNWGEMAFGVVFEGLSASSLHEARDCGEVLNWLACYYWRPNLVSTHNPGAIFNTDLCGGLPALVTRMLVDSQPGWIELLPALPPDWPNGSIQGVRARGGFEVAVAWKNGTLAKATICSLNGGPVQLRCGPATRQLALKKGQSYTWNVP